MAWYPPRGPPGFGGGRGMAGWGCDDSECEACLYGSDGESDFGSPMGGYGMLGPRGGMPPMPGMGGRPPILGPALGPVMMGGPMMGGPMMGGPPMMGDPFMDDPWELNDDTLEEEFQEAMRHVRADPGYQERRRRLGDEPLIPRRRRSPVMSPGLDEIQLEAEGIARRDRARRFALRDQRDRDRARPAGDRDRDRNRDRNRERDPRRREPGAAREAGGRRPPGRGQDRFELGHDVGSDMPAAGPSGGDPPGGARAGGAPRRRGEAEGRRPRGPRRAAT